MHAAILSIGDEIINSQQPDTNSMRLSGELVAPGCVPGELPVVLAAAAATLEPDFNLLGIATTTGTAAVALCVHGPVVQRLGMNAGTNCLGPGNRANASIGRALQLCLRNIGGARAEVGDMATMGQPGKYAFCFAERDDGPFPSLAVRRGLPAKADAITVLGVSGTAEVLPGDGEGATPEAILAPIVEGMKAGVIMSSVHRKNERGEQVFLLPLEMAEKIARHGWDIARIQQHVFDTGNGVARAPDAIHPIITGGAGVKMTYLPIWGGGSETVTRALGC